MVSEGPAALTPECPLNALWPALRDAARIDSAAVCRSFADWAGARSVGRGPPPEGCLSVSDVVWLDASTREPEVLDAAAGVVAMALELAESEARTRALLSASFEGLCLHENGRLIEANDSMATLYGYAREQMRDMPLSKLAAPEILPRIRRILAEGYSGVYESLALTASGERVPLEVRGKAAVWNGRPVRVAAFRDLRERKKVEAELVAAREAAESASRTKTRFLANMSHELRTPMNGVLGMVELMLGGQLAPEQRERAEVLRSSGAHLMGLLNDILDLSQVEEGLIVLRPRPVPLKQILTEATGTIRALANERGVAVRVSMPLALPATWTLDPLRLRQVLVNLLSNAARHTWTGCIQVSVSASQSGLEVQVEDTGEGISEAAIEGLFARFRGAPDTEARGRSGLGLSICAELVKLMGGKLSVESCVERGSTFTFQIMADPVAVPMPAGRPRRVLVADPNLYRAEQIVEAIRARGGVAKASETGAVEPEQVAAFAPDLLYVVEGAVVEGPFMVAVPATASPRPAGAVVVEAPVLADDLLRIAGGPDSDGKGQPIERFRTLEVLVVDDNSVNRLVAEQLVRRAGHIVHSVSDGLQALTACENKVWDLILMDVEMPGPSGPVVTEVLREKGYSGRIVALTAHALAEDADRCRAAGMDDVLTKPVSVVALEAALQAAAR